MASEEELAQVRRSHGHKLKEWNSEPFPNHYRVTPAQDEARAVFVRVANDEAARANLPMETEIAQDAPHVPLYGRLVAKRGPFLVIRTPHGDAQALVRPENLSEAEQAQLKLLDLADHIAVEGPAMRTKTGAAAVRAQRYCHVSKSLLPPPEKWHGLKDVEKRYRERYVDTFANPEVARVFRARSLIVQELRRFLDERHFLEVETPILHSVRGGALAKPFETHHNALDLDLFLRIAPELYLKRLLVGGFERVYEIGRVFRNEGVSTRHNPEFSILEFYQAYATYEDLLVLTREMLLHVDHALQKKYPEWIEQRPFELRAEWPQIPVRKAIVDCLAHAKKIAPEKKGVWNEVLTEATLYDASLLESACTRALPSLLPDERKILQASRTYGERIFALFEMLAEPMIVQMYRTADGTRSLPVFITEYPFEVSPLARRNNIHQEWVDRFELYIEGKEIANAFSELNDPDDQAERFRSQLVAKEKGNEEAMDYDADYIRALLHGMPPAAGFGLGIDRLVMLLCNQPSIRDVLFFPLLRPEAE